MSDEESDPTDVTLESYERHAERYVSRTPANPSPLVAVLARNLPVGATVLELGSGPGWDALAMENAGLRVQRTDGAVAFVCRLHAAGHSALKLDARASDYGGPYDAVFANAVFLHLSRAATRSAIEVAFRAVRVGGLFVASFKAGEGEGWSTEKLRAPRHFTYWASDDLAEAVGAAGWIVVDVCLTESPGTCEPGIAIVARRPQVETDASATHEVVATSS